MSEHFDPERFEEDFEREFGIGDEQQEKYMPLDYEQDDAGHKHGDFC